MLIKWNLQYNNVNSKIWYFGDLIIITAEIAKTNSSYPDCNQDKWPVHFLSQLLDSFITIHPEWVKEGNRAITDLIRTKKHLTWCLLQQYCSVDYSDEKTISNPVGTENFCWLCFSLVWSNLKSLLLSTIYNLWYFLSFSSCFFFLWNLFWTSAKILLNCESTTIIKSVARISLIHLFYTKHCKTVISWTKREEFGWFNILKPCYVI